MAASSGAIRQNDLHTLHCYDDDHDQAKSVYASSELNLAELEGETQSEHNSLQAHLPA